MDTQQILEDLKEKRERINAAISALEGRDGRGRGHFGGSNGRRMRAGGRRGVRRLSAAARKRISEAAKARWAKAKKAGRNSL